MGDNFPIMPTQAALTTGSIIVAKLVMVRIMDNAGKLGTKALIS